LLRERSFGKFEGVNEKDYERQLRALFEKFNKLSPEEKFHFRFGHGIETTEELISRFNVFLREISVGYIGKTVLVVTHGGLIRVFLIHLGYASYDNLPKGSIKNLAYIKLLADGVDYFIEEVVGVEKVG